MFVRRILDDEKNELIKIIAIGSGSTTTVCKLHKDKCKYQIISIVSNYSDGIPTPDTKIVIGLKNNKGLSAYKNFKIGKQNFKENIDEIESIIYGRTDNILLVSNIGGGTSSSGLLEIIKLINKMNISLAPYGIKRNIYVVCSNPFSFEGKIVNDNAEFVLKELKKYEKNGFIKKLLILDSSSINRDDTNLRNMLNERDKLVISCIKQTIAEIEENN